MPSQLARSVSPGLPEVTLAWHRTRLRLQPLRPEGRQAHPLVIWRGLLKSVGSRCAPAPLAFHVPDRQVRELPALFDAGDAIELEVLHFTPDPDRVRAWLQALAAHLTADARAHHRLLAEPSIEPISFSAAPALSTPPRAVEVEFLTPLPFRPTPGHPNTALTLDAFLAILHGRVKALFGLTLTPPPASGIQLQAEYWGYHKIDAPSHSQPGQREWLHGGLGPLWFRGDLAPLLPWLELAAAIHAGGKQELNPLGYCRLRREPQPHFDPLLARPGLYRQTLEHLSGKGDEGNAALALLQAREAASPEAACRTLAAAIAAGTWHPAPAQVLPIPKHGGVRWVETFEPETQLVLASLHQLLVKPLDRLFSPASFGFRPGRSVDAAMDRIQSAIAAGYRHIVRTDIHDCFGAIDLDLLEARLDEVLPPADIRLRQLLHLCLRGEVARQGQIAPRQRGLAQGSPLSPLLANLYLDRLDRCLEEAPGHLTRFADDIALLARSRAEAEELLARAQAAVNALRLTLNDDKTLITEAEAGFTFLGQRLDGEGVETPPHRCHLPQRKTLYVTALGTWLGNNGEAVEVHRRGAPPEVIPLRRLGSIIVLAPASLSTGLIGRCASAGVPITIAPFGHNAALIAPASRGFLETAAQQAEHWHALGPTGRLAIARRLVEAKLNGYACLLRQRYAPGMNQLLHFIERQIQSFTTVPDTDALRGHEGATARQIQRAIDGFIQVEAFHFARRDRLEPDLMNPLFNLGYHLLYGRISSALRGAGLNPWLGYLHDAGDAYESLTCDLQELFRAPVDRMLLALVNRRQIQPEHYVPGPHGPRFSAEAIRIVAAGYEAMLQDQRRELTMAQAIDAQVEAVRRYVQGREGLWIYRWGQERTEAINGGEEA